MTHKNAFTLVELIIVIAIIGILATIAVIAFSPIQQSARDSQRSSKVTTLSEALEKYYSQNGEYPSPRALLNTYSGNTAQSIATKLSIDPLTIQMPQAPSGTTNSISSTVSPTTIAYVASSDVNNTSCQTKIDGGCDQYTLSYKEESTDNVVSIESRHKGRPDEFATIPEAPATPTLNATQSGTTINATSSITDCDSGSFIPQYSFRQRSNSGSWSSWNSWQASNIYARTSNTDGTLYGFQVKTRCWNATVTGIESAPSSEASISYLKPLVAPATPTLVAALVNGDAQGSASTTCQSQSTLEYQFKTRTNAGTWTTGAWGSASTVAIDAPQPGVRYGFIVTARCIRDSTIKTSAATTEVTYTHPISTPSTPSMSVSTSGDNTTYSWSTTVCPAGTTARYQYRLIGDWSYDSGWLGPYVALNSTVWNTYSQGYQYTVQVQTQCYTSYATSAWSGTSQGNYIRPMTGPSGISFGITRDGPYQAWANATSSCGPGATLYSRSDMHTWDYFWTDTGAYGWYSDSHGGAWINNNWAYYGTTFQVGSTGEYSGTVYASGSRWNMAVDMQCRNTVTGRVSGTTGRIESGILYLP